MLPATLGFAACGMSLASGEVLGDFSRHGRYEPVIGPAGTRPAETAILTRDATSATLSAPWPDATGKARVRVQSNQHDDAVAFELPIP